MTWNQFEAIRAFCCNSETNVCQQVSPITQDSVIEQSHENEVFRTVSTITRINSSGEWRSPRRGHNRQYTRNKPTKWGFKFWVLANPTGYTLDFNVYGGQRGTPQTAHGLSFDVVMELVRPCQHQGYYLFSDNFYTIPALVQKLEEVCIRTTGKLTEGTTRCRRFTDNLEVRMHTQRNWVLYSSA